MLKQVEEYERQRIAQIGSFVQSRIPADHGYMVLTFPMKSSNAKVRYASNVGKKDVIKVLKGLLFHWCADDKLLKGFKI